MSIASVPDYAGELTPEGSQYPLPDKPRILAVKGEKIAMERKGGKTSP